LRLSINKSVKPLEENGAIQSLFRQRKYSNSILPLSEIVPNI
jgi:hypothetical protein